MAQIAVVEDNDAMRAQLCGFIAQYAQESGHQLDVTAFSDGAQLVEPYRPGFDIIFLDIEMPTLGGMPTAERIRRQDPDVVLVFVTNMAQYAIRGYEVDALDFVLKPVSYYQFSTKLERALQRIRRRRGGQVALQVSGGVQLLDTDDILYLETRDRLLHYHTATDTWSVRGSLLKAEKDLAAYHFDELCSILPPLTDEDWEELKQSRMLTIQAIYDQLQSTLWEYHQNGGTLEGVKKFLIMPTEEKRQMIHQYLAIDGAMHAGFYEGQGSIGHETGTSVRIRCPKSKLEGLKPATRRTQVNFRQLMAYLEEETAYTYAPLFMPD